MNWLLTRLSLFRIRHLWFLANFGVAKLAVYFIPILIAFYAGGEFYGAIELALATSLLLATLLTGAQVSGITQLFLVHNEREVDDLLLFLTAIPAIAGGMIAALLLIFDGPIVIALICAVLPPAISQNVAGSWCRMLERPNLTAWSDGISVLLCGLTCLVALARSDDELTRSGTAILASVSCFIGFGCAALFFRARLPSFRKRIWMASAIGLPIMISSTLGIWLGVGGRILVGIVNAADIAVFAVAFRIAGLVLGVHQLATTAFFARLYRARTREADRIFTYFFATIGLVAALISVAGPWIVDSFQFGSVSGGDNLILRVLIPVAGAQTFFWIGHAMLQMRINRAGLAKSTIVPTLLLTIGGATVIIAAGFGVSNDVLFISVLISIHAACYFALNWILLALRGLPHKRLGISAITGGLVLFSIAGLEFLSL